MALIAMAVYDTVENKRTELTKKTLLSLFTTVDFSKHRLIISDNGSCEATLQLYKDVQKSLSNPSLFTIEDNVIYNGVNLGTAEAINKAWRTRRDGENAIKMDNDVVMYKEGWVDEMERAIARDGSLGQVGLKRKDCWENPEHTDPFYKSELKMLPHKAGEAWIVVEEVNHVMGTCVMHSSALLDKVGYLYQPKLYGFDDSFMSLRSKLGGFKNVFLPHINIDHIDTEPTEYQKWKEAHANSCWVEYHRLHKEYREGKTSIYYNPFNNE
jgi:GT2 family glycosyltransferase